MRKWCILFLFFPVVVIAQKNNPGSLAVYPIDSRVCKANFHIVPLGSSDTAIVANYLRNTIPALSNRVSPVSLKVLSNIESQAGVHILFQQLYNNIPVYRAQVKVNLDKSGTIISVFDNSFNTDPNLPNNFPDSAMAIAYLKGDAGNNSQLSQVSHLKIERNYFFTGDTLIPALRVEVSTKGLKHYEFFLDPKGGIAYQQDLNYYHHPGDSIVTATVFLPDPLTTAGVLWGCPYCIPGIYYPPNYVTTDTNIACLDAQRITLNMKVDYTNDTFSLKSPNVLITELSAPVVYPPVFKSNPNFNYKRADPGFNAVNAFYGISYQQQHVQNLGFKNLPPFQLLVDVHGNDYADNSFFSFGVPESIIFGDGGVPDANDADVIFHEYGHAISYGAAPNTNSGFERQTMDEGDGDYLASSYSRYVNPFYWWNVFSFDGHNIFWPGRLSRGGKIYPDSMVTQNNGANIYTNADLWSSTLMDVWGDIGRDAADKDLFEMMYSFVVNMTMPQAAMAYIQADSTLYGGMHYNILANEFYNRGLIPAFKTLGVNELSPSPYQWVRLINSQGFSNNSNTTIQFQQPSSGVINLMDITGKLILQESISNALEYPVNGTSLASGIYILNIITPLQSANFKLVK